MKRMREATGLALLLIFLAGAGKPAYSGVQRPHAFDCTLEPVSELTTDAPVTMKLTFTPAYPCGNKVAVTVTTLNYVQTFSENTWEVELQDDQPCSTTFQVSIPDDDTSSVHVTLECGRLRERIERVFVSTGDTVEYWIGRPRHYGPHPPPPQSDPIRDTLTEEQLATEYEVVLDLRDSAHLKIAEEILGPLPDSAKHKYKGRQGYYLLMASLQELIELADAGIGFEFTSPPPWDRRYRPPEDSLPEKRPETDS